MSYCRQNVLYYIVIVANNKYVFPVPLEDLNGATIYPIEKAITLMRYIRKAIKESTFVKTY